MTKINKFNSIIVYNCQNEKRTLNRIAPMNPRSVVRRPSHYTMSCVGNTVTLVVAVVRVLNLLCDMELLL